MTCCWDPPPPFLAVVTITGLPVRARAPLVLMSLARLASGQLVLQARRATGEELGSTGPAHGPDPVLLGDTSHPAGPQQGPVAPETLPPPQLIGALVGAPAQASAARGAHGGQQPGGGGGAQAAGEAAGAVPGHAAPGPSQPEAPGVVHLAPLVLRAPLCLPREVSRLLAPAVQQQLKEGMAVDVRLRLQVGDIRRSAGWVG